MRQMLVSTRCDFEITQTYTLFTGILCWVTQRVRWKEDYTPLRDNMAALRTDLEKISFHEFVRQIARPRLQEVALSASAPDSPRFNDFTDLLAKGGADMCACDGLVHLRNAVAHGDHRRIMPLNKDSLLLGYRIECGKKPNTDNRATWTATVCLDRKGMAFIAETLADKFCKAALPEMDTKNARAIRENRQ